MYRLLIVSENEQVHSMIGSMQGWEIFGFKAPHFRTDVQGAKECMQNHEINTVGVHFESCAPELIDFLNKEYPNIPIFPIQSTADRQMEVIRKVSRMLSRLHADDSNVSVDVATRMQEQRDRWMRKLMCGLEKEEDLALHIGMYRSPEGMDVPCCLSLISLPEDDLFLSERWHYGGERLETALRNFFGREHGNKRIYVALPSGRDLRVLICPKNGELDFSEAERFVREAANQVDNYLELKLEVKENYRLTGLRDLAIRQTEK